VKRSSIIFKTAHLSIYGSTAPNAQISAGA